MMSNEPYRLRIPPMSETALRVLAEEGILGTTVEEVATYLLIRSLDDLLRSRGYQTMATKDSGQTRHSDHDPMERGEKS